MSALTDDEMQVALVDAIWVLPTQIDAFLDWLDESGLAQDTEDSLAAFRLLEVAKLMPESLKSDLRKKGY